MGVGVRRSICQFLSICEFEDYGPEFRLSNDVSELRATIRHSSKVLEPFCDGVKRFVNLYLHIRVMRKPTFCICENKDGDQLRGNREADQRLCFRYIDKTTQLVTALKQILMPFLPPLYNPSSF